MKTTYRNKPRYTCDKCGKLISQGKMSRMMAVRGEVIGEEDRWYHFCNPSQYRRFLSDKYQLRLFESG